MDKQSLIKVIREAARKHRYTCRGSASWRVGEDGVVSIIEVQSSNFGSGKYINVGVMPQSFMIRPKPLNDGYWPLRHRASSIPSPYISQFSDLQFDHDDKLNADDFSEAFDWLFGWLTDTWGTHDKLKTLYADPNWIYRKYANFVFPDWMEGNLKSITEYYDKLV